MKAAGLVLAVVILSGVARLLVPDADSWRLVLAGVCFWAEFNCIIKLGEMFNGRKRKWQWQSPIRWIE